MKRFLGLVSVLLMTVLAANGQSSNSASIDSLRAANRAKTDSIKAANLARRDSLAQLRDQRAQAKRQAELDKKAAKKNQDLEVFQQEDYSKADSMRDVRMDSLKLAREQAAELRKLQQEKNRASSLSIRKKKIPPLTQEMSFGYRLASDGWSLFVHRGFIHSEDPDQVHTNFVWFDLSEKHHPKESSTLNENYNIVYPNEEKPVSYKYGKINNFYQFKFGYGNTKPLTGRLDKKSIVIHWVYAGGLSLGLLKPYYLYIFTPDGRTYAKYSEQNKEYFLDLNDQGTIIGGTNFTKGINGIKIQPGLTVRSALNFDYAYSRKSFLGIEIGATAELYFKEIPIMATAKNNAFFVNIYADIRFGKRWE